MSESSNTRWTVILGAAAGRPVDRAEFTRRYAPVIRAYLGARWNRTALAQEIDDAVQDVFVDCFAENGALVRVDPDRAGGFRAFLFGVVRNVAKRVESRRREVQPPSGFDAASSAEPLSGVFDRAWAQSIMRQAGELQAERARANDRAREEFTAALHEVVRRHHPDGDTGAECSRLLEYFR